MTTGINISVLPSYLHSYNPCENLIRNASRGCRKALENLVGLECPAGTIIDRDTATEWWDTSYESWMQTYNLSPNDAVERMFAAGVNPTQAISGDMTQQLDVNQTHAYGEEGFMVVEDKARGGSAFPTSERIIHLFDAGILTSIFNQTITFPGSSYVVLQRTRRPEKSGKLKYPSESIIDRRAVMSARDAVQDMQTRDDGRAVLADSPPSGDADVAEDDPDGTASSPISEDPSTTQTPTSPTFSDPKMDLFSPQNVPESPLTMHRNTMHRPQIITGGPGTTSSSGILLPWGYEPSPRTAEPKGVTSENHKTWENISSSGLGSSFPGTSPGRRRSA